MADGGDQPSAMIPFPIQHQPCAFTGAFVAVEKRRPGACQSGEHIAPFRFLLDQDPVDERTRRLYDMVPEADIRRLRTESKHAIQLIRKHL